MPQQNEFWNNTYNFPSKPRNMWEVGLSGGLFNVSGDVSSVIPTFGFAAHVRKSLGYVFSLRLQYLYGNAKGLNWNASENFAKNEALSQYYSAPSNGGTTIPGRTPDLVYYNYKNTGRPTGAPVVFWSHYEDEKNSPLYPFGYGLSYTSFEYSNLQVKVVSGNKVNISVTLKNSGQKTGKEVVQLYIRDHFASVTRPVRELKGFELVTLEPSESKEISFTLTEEELGFYDNDGQFIFEKGDFTIFVGGDSNANLQAQITL